MPKRSLLAGCLMATAGVLLAWGNGGASEPHRDSMQVAEGLPLSKASVNGKYRVLLRTFAVPQDKQNYTEFRDWGYYTGTEYYGYKNLPAGHWVYVYPRWYIWGEKVK